VPPAEGMESTAPQQCTGELDEAFVVGRLLVIPDEDRAALRQPREGALDHPASRRVTLLTSRVELLLANTADVWDESGGLAGGLAGRVVVGLVQAQVLGEPLRVRRLSTIVSIVASSSLVSWTLAPSISRPSGPPRRSTIRLFLVAGLALSVGLDPLFAPPMRALLIIPSAACQVQPRLPSRSHSAASTAQISSNTLAFTNA